MEKNKLILLYEKRSELIKRMKELPTRAKAENRDLTEAEKAEWQTIDAEYDRLSNDFLRESKTYEVDGFYFAHIEPLMLARTKELYEVRAEAHQTGKTKVVEMLNVFIEMREAYAREQAVKSEKEGRLIFDPTYRHEEEKEEEKPVYAGARVAGYSW